MNIQQIEERIDHYKSVYLMEDTSTPYMRGYLDFLDDVDYACSLSETALVGHLKAWLDFIPETEYDKGYMQARKDISEEIESMKEKA